MIRRECVSPCRRGANARLLRNVKGERDLVRASDLVGFELTEFEAPSNPGRCARTVQTVIRMIEPVFLAGPDAGASVVTNLPLEPGPAGDGHVADGGDFEMLLHELIGVATRRERRHIESRDFFQWL